MDPSFIQAIDGTRIAYDVSGEGPPIVLLHGGAQGRHVWHVAGYVDRLKATNQVITIDMRGHGDSDRPPDSALHRIDLLCDDVLGVANACGAEQFALWGFSYGGNIGRYLAARSPRVERFVMIGAVFGPGASGNFRERLEANLAHWEPIVNALSSGRTDESALTMEERTTLSSVDVPAMLAWMAAILDWPAIEPREIECPTLWLCGGEDEAALDCMQQYRNELAGTHVTTEVVDGLNHFDELWKIDAVFPSMFEFTLGEQV